MRSISSIVFRPYHVKGPTNQAGPETLRSVTITSELSRAGKQKTVSETPNARGNNHCASLSVNNPQLARATNSAPRTMGSAMSSFGGPTRFRGLGLRACQLRMTPNSRPASATAAPKKIARVTVGMMRDHPSGSNGSKAAAPLMVGMAATSARRNRPAGRRYSRPRHNGRPGNRPCRLRRAHNRCAWSSARSSGCSGRRLPSRPCGCCSGTLRA